jgi:hypothetical protein
MNQTVFDATQKYPELIGIIASWGFPQIKNNLLRRTMGSRYTINQAIRELGLNRSQICESLRSHGFDLRDN